MSDRWLTEKEAAALLGCSVTTAKRWHCGWCDESALMIARGHCGAIYGRCDTTEKAAHFVKRHKRHDQET